MTLDIRILNFKKSIEENKPKGIVRYKFRKYTQEYENLEREPSVLEKINHRDLTLEFYRYLAASGDRK